MKFTWDTEKKIGSVPQHLHKFIAYAFLLDYYYLMFFFPRFETKEHQ